MHYVDMLMEIIKVAVSILASSTIATLIVGYFINKKLEERKMMLKINEQFISSLTTGLNQLMNSYKSLVSKTEEIKQQIEQGHLSQESVNKLKELKANYHATLDTHRIYLTALIPFGGTQEHDYSFDDINMVAARHLLDILALITAQDGGAAFEKYKHWSLEAIRYVNESYNSVCRKANTIAGYLREGKNPLVIRWRDINSDSWDSIGQRMFEEFISLDIEDTPEPLRRQNNPTRAPLH
jgi:hypothetical protein